MIVTYIYSNNLVDQTRVQIRCRNLADAINRTGSHRANLLDMNSFVQNTPYARQICGASDLLVIYRYLHGPILTAVQYWKARGRKVIVDFDQAVNHLTKENPAYSFWYEGVPQRSTHGGQEPRIDPAPIEQFKWGLALMDAATTPSARLAEDWAQYTNVYKVFDYINISQYPLLNCSHENEIWVGLGNRVTYDSFEKCGLLEAMENVCRQRRNVRMIYGLEYTARKPAISPDQQVTYFPGFFDEWVTILLNLNLGLMPAFGEYDLRLGSSDLLEFMIAKIPWLASSDLAFYKLSNYGQWVQNSAAAWEDAILDTLDHLEVHQRKALGKPFLFAISQDVGANIDGILNTYSAIIGR